MRAKSGFLLVLSSLFLFSACTTEHPFLIGSSIPSFPPELIGAWKYAGVRVLQSQIVFNRGFFPPQISSGTCIQKIGGALDIHPDGTFSFREASIRKCPLLPGTISTPTQQSEMEKMKRPIFASGHGTLEKSFDGTWQLISQTPSIHFPIAKLEIISGSHCPFLRISGISDFPFEDIAFQEKQDHFSDKDLIKLASFSHP